MQLTFLDRIQEYSLHQQKISLNVLHHLHEESVNNSSESGFFWELQELKNQKIVQQIDENNYKILSFFKPNISEKILQINRYLFDKFDLSNYCIWSSDWFNQFSRHQITQNFVIIEIEKEAAESIFYELKEADFGEVFLILQKEDEVLLDRYVFEAKNPIIIQKIITKAPKQLIKIENESIFIPHLEKMLVDLFVDNSVLIAYKGAEQNQIVETALLNYVLDFKKMFAYATRRGKEQELKKYLFEHFVPQINQIFS